MDGQYLVEVNTPRVKAALVQPGHAAISLQRAQHAARMRHAQNRRMKEQQAMDAYGSSTLAVSACFSGCECTRS